MAGFRFNGRGFSRRRLDCRWFCLDAQCARLGFGKMLLLRGSVALGDEPKGSERAMRFRIKDAVQ